ncbi:dITPase [Methanothermus fervidus DSM 2088]|uniref:dITP/XTP pyrophosphatase n=1 Tax=Methanothermus fervidus (strain ATCC 43054 / DSM 2088 / JCM 10308 / V24 S) TaxID=523846 RepID=E3GZH4_METFV|nr:XTP/dITP diphosphatase [Methanothermus fervidus]ADP77706.1 dITPase [Methanothermus fervidus DSM 2088]
MKKVIFITSNLHKVSEARKIFEENNIEMEHRNVKYYEIQGSLEEVASHAAKKLAEKLNHPVIVEDAGLFIKALNGFPGPYSSYVQKTIGNKGILKLMENIEDRQAEFKSVVGYCEPGSKPKIFVGVVKGNISTEEIGDKGFAFDPIFYPEGYKKTFGELDPEEKNRISHRGKSFRKFVSWFKKQQKVIK